MKILCKLFFPNHDLVDMLMSKVIALNRTGQTYNILFKATKSH